MSSLLNNLGPRYSQRNGTTPIILGFLLLIIGIAVVTYFITRDDKGDKDKKEDDDGETVPSIGDLTIKRTFNPDSSNSSESSTETYEIGGGKTETYQIEYNTGISDTELSKNVTISISWENKSGFDDVYKLEIEHFVSETSATSIPDATLANDIITINRYSDGNKRDSGSVEINENKKFFKNYNKTGLTKNFTGDGTYSFVGNSTFRIKAYYRDTSTHLYKGLLSNTDATSGDVVSITSDELAATIGLASAITTVYNPIQTDFTLSDPVIDNKSYYAYTRLGGDDIIKSIDGQASARPFTLIRANDTNKNEFYFKFSDTEYLGYTESGGVKNLAIKSADNKQIVKLVKSKYDDDTNEGNRHFLLKFDISGVSYYIVVDKGEGLLKQMSEIDSEILFDTLDWKFSDKAGVSTSTPDKCEYVYFTFDKYYNGYKRHYLKLVWNQVENNWYTYGQRSHQEYYEYMSPETATKFFVEKTNEGKYIIKIYNTDDGFDNGWHGDQFYLKSFTPNSDSKGNDFFNFIGSNGDSSFIIPEMDADDLRDKILTGRKNFKIICKDGTEAHF